MKVLAKEQLFVVNLTQINNKKTVVNKLSQFIILSSMLMVGATNAAIKLSGEMEQGALIIGKTEAKSTVTLNNKALPVSAHGDYVFAFSRDDNTEYTLKIVSSSGKVESKTFTPKKREYNISRVEGISKKIMNPSEAAIKRSAKDRIDIGKVRKVSSDLTGFSKGFIAPRSSRITGVYGSQRFYNGEPKNPHYGVDYAGKIGAIVKSPADGKVLLWVPDMFYSGGTMVIDHGHGITSNFLHLSASLVKVGDVVKQGQAVAKVGNSGRVTGPHLDWRMNWHQVRFDPQLAMKVIPLK